MKTRLFFTGLATLTLGLVIVGTLYAFGPFVMLFVLAAVVIGLAVR